MDGEPVDKFVVHLRQQARHCNFSGPCDDNLRDQFMEKLPDMELKKKLLETRNITLAHVLDKTRAWEVAGQQVKYMAGALDINAVRRKEDNTNNKSAKTCFSCGKAGHLSWDPCCPAKGRKCSNCLMYETSTALHQRKERTLSKENQW